MTSVRSKLRQLLAALLVAWCGSASAYWIGFVPATTTQPLNSPFSINVVISGLQTDGQVLSTYDFTVGFNASILQLTSAQASGALGAGSLFLSTPGVGSVNLFELSALTDAQLAAQQSDLFTIATLSFIGIGLGTSPLAFSDLFALGGSQVQGQTFNLLTLPFTVGAAEVTIESRAVPEPATVLLLALALPLLAPYAKRRRR